ncbi:uncharacterized protein LOC122394654 isoform X2 [Amphibalanus amphitrite]|uniref:uncharacterized protein LOC122394654 isoform X2 n=1 Tax=Amphibalanus amphitrite TaxID=1232801 RepID=UPI001C91CB09|nr:uncharacterized protein LOC122394654 isoform X2 [Amphibalanus amphitrite]
MEVAAGLRSGKSVLILSLVVGCFALLWPRIFFPMLQSSFTPAPPETTNEAAITGTRPPSILPCCHPVPFTKERNALFFTELCRRLSWRADRSSAETASLHLPPEPRPDIWTPGLAGWCADELWRACGVQLDEPALEKFRRAADDPPTRNLTGCLEGTFGVRRADVRPPRGIELTAANQLPAGRRVPVHPGLRGDLPPAAQAHLHDINRQPKRIMDRMGRPGPQPGSRPTPGGYGAVPPSTKGSSTMGIIMPIYTIGIVVFFVYTILKVMFKNPDPSESKEPIIPDYHLSTEYRSYGYHSGSGRSTVDGAPTGRCRPVVVRRPPPEPETPPPRQKAAVTAAAAPAANSVPAAASAQTRPEDAEIDQLRRRLEETERAMERIMKQMSTVSEKLNVAKISSNIKAIKQDLWGSTDSVASDSLASERSLSMESLAQTEASLASLEEDVGKAAQAVNKKKGSKEKNGHAAANGTKADVSGRRRVQELKS